MSKLTYTETELVELTGIGARYWRARRMAGDGPVFIKISGKLGQRGGRVVYPARELNEWLAKQPRGGGSECR